MGKNTINQNQAQGKQSYSLENIPRFFKELNNWVNWKIREVDGKRKKEPVDKAGYRIDITKPQNFLCYRQAYETLRQFPSLDGIGFALTPKGGLCCIDIDNAFTEEGLLKTQAWLVLKAIGTTYVEYSPSLKGLHVWVKATFNGGRKFKSSEGVGVEVYGRDHYMTMTGWHFGVAGYEHHPQVEAKQAEIEALVAELEQRGRLGGGSDKQTEQGQTSDRKKTTATGGATPVDATAPDWRSIDLDFDPIGVEDEKLIARIFASAQGAKFKALYLEGDLSAYGGDHSAADQALANILAWWTNGDTRQICRIFTSSILARDKWTNRKGDDYAARTIAKALQCADRSNPVEDFAGYQSDYQHQPGGEQDRGRERNDGDQTGGPYLNDTARKADKEQNQERPFEERQAEYKARFGRGRTEAFRRHLAEAANRQKIPTGIEALDDMLGGGLRPGLYMIQAMPSAGKTTLSYQIADNIAANGQDVLFYSLEMGEEEITAKSYSRITWERSGHNIRQAKSGLQLLDPEFYQHASAEDLAITENAIRQYEDTSGQHLIIMTDNDARTKPSDIANDIENHIAYTGNTPLVFIDYFQLLHPPLANGTDKQNADMNIVALKQLCRKYKIPIWAISSMNRGGYENPFGMASMKESGNLEFAGDVIMGLAFTDKNGTPTHKEQALMELDEATAYRVGLHIIKGRLIKTGPMKPGLVFFGAYNSFEPYDKRQDGKDDATIYEAAMDTLIFQLEEPHRQTGLSPRQIIRADGDQKHRSARAAILKTGLKAMSLEGLIKDAIERKRAYIDYGEGDGNNRPEILRATSTRKTPKGTRKDDGKDAEGGLFK